MEVNAGDHHGTIDPAADDWKTLELGQLGTFLKGSGVKKDEAKSGNLPCIRYGEIYTHHNDIIRKFNSSISPTVAIAATKLRYGDLLFAGSGETKEDIGKCVAFVDNCEAYAGGDIVILRLKDANPTFMGYLSNSPYVSKQKASRAQGDAVVHISANSLSTIKISLPPLSEQQAIANALSDVDQLIASLDQLIAKKRDLKQAAMQQLLTGKTRLQGFSGEWKAQRLSTMCELVTKGTTPTSIGRNFARSGVNFLKAESLSERGDPIVEKIAFIDSSTHKLLKRSQLKAGDFLISIAGVIGRVGRVPSTILPANTNQALAIVRLDSSAELDSNFFFYSLKSPIVTKQISDVNVQAAQANISLRNVSDIEILIPPTLHEQISISKILVVQDAELAELEQRRDKTIALKQGMMQELLTGRTRLV